MFALRRLHLTGLLQGEHPKILAGIGEGYRRSAFWRTKALISLKRGKIGPMLLLRSNRKSYMRFRLVPKSTTLDYLQGSLCTLFQNTCAIASLFICFSLHIHSAFSRQMTVGAITTLKFRKLNQITITESLGAGKTCCIARFPCDSTAFLLTLFYRSM